ncbi:hypothetical protein ACFORO_32910 [Amycolatopsis halotolerans]|uniref:Uncharacterized protein n=1 Tax=Amycolatopsis halotolerans TaxID=330083 RepID=A0ABV7QRR1_9PSEU
MVFVLMSLRGSGEYGRARHDTGWPAASRTCSTTWPSHHDIECDVVHPGVYRVFVENDSVCLSFLIDQTGLRHRGAAHLGDPA